MLQFVGMQSVVATFPNQTSATQAVRALEPELSIQDMVVADLKHRAWRKLHPPEGKRFPDSARFAVVVIDHPQEVERARELLKQRAV